MEYDLIDLGCSEGGFVEYARGALGVKTALGIDIRPEMEEKAKEKGFDFLCSSVHRLSPMRARIISASHFLEHLGDWGQVESIIRWMLKSACEFSIATGPAWDCESLLRINGLRFYWGEWADHIMPTTASGIRSVLDRIGVSYDIFVSGMMRDSMSPEVVLAGSSWGSKDNNELKPMIKFRPNLFCAYTMIAWVGGSLEAEEICRKYRSDKEQFLSYSRRVD